MARLTVTSFVTLDGVMQAPGGNREDRSGGFLHGGWVMPHADEGFGAFMVDIFSRPSAFLLGRGTWEIFASHWPKVTDPNDPIAAALNKLPKYVATRTLRSLEWAGSTPIRDVKAEVARLKQELPGELQVHGSPGLIQSLLEYELVDELNLLTFPVVLGRGKRLFGGGAVPAAFEVASAKVTSKGVVTATYRWKGPPVLQDVHPARAARAR